VRLLLAMLGTAGLASVMLMLAILARLTRRWQAITRARSHYPWFYVASILVGLASLARLVRIGYLPLTADAVYPPGEIAPALGQVLVGDPLPTGDRQVIASLSPFLESDSWFYLLFYHLPLVIALTISLTLAWRNWGWLLWTKEK
jgi:hypothetical protein